MPKIKAVFFDLDDTLFDCSGMLVDNARHRAAKAMIKAGLPVDEKKAFAMQVEVFKKLGPMENIFDRMCDKLKVKGDKRKKIVRAGFNAYNSDRVEKIKPFPDVLPTLKQLKKQGIKTVLITSGIFERQENKVRALGLQNKFDLILIHDIEKDASKHEKFRLALHRLKLKASNVLVVGDRVFGEIRIGNSLGMTSVRILKGRFRAVKPRSDLEEPDYSVRELGELPELIERVKSKKKNGRELRVVAIGGGTGLPGVLSGLKEHTKRLTAIVTVTDSGRSSGMLRKDLKMLPPGDIRNCLISLSNSETLLKDLFQYRFSCGGNLNGMSLGNLFIAGLEKVTGSFEKAIQETSKILAIEGRVLPSTLHDTHLCAELVNGKIVEQEFNVRKPGKLAIKRVFLKPANVKPLPETLKAIKEADLIVFGPGSLFTSVITNLLVKGISGAIKNSKAKKVYICNIMTQPGQTDGFSLSMHVAALERYLGKNVLDAVVFNSGKPPEAMLKKYRKEKAGLVVADIENLSKKVKPVSFDLLGKRVVGEQWKKANLLRHDSGKLAKTLLSLV